jgi:hypothetical protein
MFSLLSLLLTGIGLLCLWYLVTFLRSPLRQHPGPFLASLTDWWRVYHTLDIHNVSLRLHKKYGPVVRLGPNSLSLSDATYAKIIYNTRGNFGKVIATLVLM